jgi:hypothetical protein
MRFLGLLMVLAAVSAAAGRCVLLEEFTWDG